MTVEDNKTFVALQWSLGDDTGLSSKQLVGRYFGIRTQAYAPADAADRGRCIRALKKMPWLKSALAILEETDVEWRAQAELIRAGIQTDAVVKE
jgi:hypothetical protein